MELVNVKEVIMKDVLEFLEEEFDISNIKIKFWEDKEVREMGISSIHSPLSNELQEIIFEAKRLVDRDGKASVEVISEEDEEVLYFYDGVTEQILPC